MCILKKKVLGKKPRKTKKLGKIIPEKQIPDIKDIIKINTWKNNTIKKIYIIKKIYSHHKKNIYHEKKPRQNNTIKKFHEKYHKKIEAKNYHKKYQTKK